MRTAARLFYLLLPLLAAFPAHGGDAAPNLTNPEVTDCVGDYSSNLITLSTARPNLRINFQDADPGGGLAFGQVPVKGGGLSTNVLALHFDAAGPFADSSGHGNTAIDAGTPGPAGSVNALFGDARAFSGSGHVRVPASLTLNVSTLFSMQAWIKPTGPGLDSMPILEYNKNDGTQGSTGVQFWVGNSTSAKDSLYALLVTTTNRKFVVESPTGVIDKTGKWQHVALTYNGVDALLYHNGVIVASNTIGFVAPLQTTYDLYVGRRPTGFPPDNVADNFVGSIDEVIVTSRALSAEAIASAYHAGYIELTNPTGFQRILLSTDTADGHYVTAAQEMKAVATATVSNVDFSPGNNRVRFVFRNSSGATSSFLISGISTDISPPSTPNTFTGTATQTDEIEWSWGVPNHLCLLQVNPDLPGRYRVKYATDAATLPSGDNLTASPFTETGLGTNTLNSRAATAFDAYGESNLTAAATIYTKAAPPASPSLTQASTGHLSVAWNGGTNPGYTRYEVSLWDSVYVVSSSTPVPINADHTTTSYDITGLAAATTYYVQIRAKNGRSSDFFGEIFTNYLSTAMPTLVGKPAGLTSTIDSDTAVTWSWPQIVTAQSYTLYRHPDNTVLTTTAGTSFQVTGLPVNEVIQAKLRVNNGSGAGLVGDPVTAFTDALAPTGMTTTAISTGAVSLSWNANGNPANTSYQVFKAADNGFTGNTESKTVSQTNASFNSLLPGTTYYFRVRAISRNSNPSGYSSTVQAVTDVFDPISQSDTPKTPYAAEPGEVAIYHFDEGSGTVVLDSSTANNNGVLTCTFVNCSTPTYTSGRTGFGTAVRFSGDQNTYCAVPDDASLNTSGNLSIEAWIKPDNTPQIQEATIIAKGIGTGEAFGLDIVSSKARFFYRSAGPSAIKSVSSTQNIIAGRWTHVVGVYSKTAPNNTIKIYIDGALSNTASFADAARLTNTHALSIGNRKSGATDYDRGFQGLIDEVHILTAELTASSVTANYQSGLSSTMTMTAPNDGVQLIVPPDAFGGTASITVSSDPVGNPIVVSAQNVIDGLNTPPAGTYLVPGSLIEIIASMGGVPLPGDFIFASSVTVAIAYPDANANSIVDGTEPPLPAATLAMYTLNATVGSWDLLPSVVDTANRRVLGQTEHFSVFALFGTSRIQPETNSVVIYPVPWKPGSNGRFDSATHPNGRRGLAFDNLTEEGTIRIFTLSGERVISLSYAGSDQGMFIWDGKNAAGRDVASGIYFAYIKPDRGAVVVLKFAVER